MFRVFVFFVCFYGILVISASAQNSKSGDLFVCNEVERKISNIIEISKVARRVFNEDNCEFYLYSGKEWLSVDIKKYKTLQLSKKAFSREFNFLTLAKTFPESVRKLDQYNFWNEAKGYFKDLDADHLIMLRYKKINFTLIGSNYNLILKIEPLLRNIKYENYQK